MLSSVEMMFLKDVKARAKKGLYVSADEKAIVLRLVKREQVALRPETLKSAKEKGFNVDGIKSL